MTGYLQRLVASAMKPAPRVHPVLVPIFSAPKYSAESAESKEDEAVSGEELLSSSIRQRKAPTFAEDAGLPRTSRPFSETTAAVVPPGPRMQSAAETAAELPSSNAGRTQTEDPIHNRIETGQPPAAETRNATLAESEFIPLLPEVATPFESDSLSGQLQNPNSPAPGNRNYARSGAANPSAPDEIKITIGRIEVMAVPETHARPAVKPVRRQISLDEYLKRADERRR